MFKNKYKTEKCNNVYGAVTVLIECIRKMEQQEILYPKFIKSVPLSCFVTVYYYLCGQI
jgi:hypothetical protein